ncbi:peptidyl-prolyl cis-trans isomerase C [Mariprofundus micogutta]|uniref:peptidylprolyl isomerase n=1 Tax=Mariprofundus micogutta TaxID=1921010 RepID=A0A1L8CL57_9PROT|nr:peptidylprolyl isomerase [Mariprofundus micogutta]GAV19579.1 peptidyl-prolyl cis-trans isomerase C [Mariprofundus micogutta]
MRFLLLIFLGLLAACQQQDESLQQDANLSPVVARVGGVAIHESDIDVEMANMPDTMYQYRDDPKARGHILRSLVHRQAISQKARQLGLDLDPAIQQRIESVRRQILIDAAKEWQLVNMKKIQDAEIQVYYKKHLDEFTVPEQVHARHILVRTEKQAWDLLKKLRKNRASFTALAASQSLDDSNKSRGGDLNWFPRGVMVKAFDDAVFELKKHGLSRPVRTKFGWHVIELLGKREAALKSLDEVRVEIISVLQHQRLQQWYGEVEAAANITIEKPEYR